MYVVLDDRRQWCYPGGGEVEGGSNASLKVDPL